MTSQVITGTDFDDPMEEIKKIKRLGSVKEYQAVFERNLTRSKSATLLLYHKYKKTARMQEAYLSAIRQTTGQSTYINPPKKYMESKGYDKLILHNPSTSKVHRWRLSPEEMNEKRAQGLCFFCDERYTIGHKCKNAKQLYLLELEEQEEVEQSQLEGTQDELALQIHNSEQIREQMKISIHALNGSLGYRTFKISPQVVAAANGVMKVDKVCRISWLLQGAEFVAEFLILPLGSCGVVLGVQWLLTLGDMKMNFRKLTMEFIYKGKRHVLRGAGRQILNPRARKLAKITDEFKTIFDEPTQLPPSRGVFDHRIILQNDQGIIQPSSSPFAASVVLVGKKDGTWKLCVDYRDLNKATVKNKFPIPIVEDLLDELGGSKVFSKIDLRSLEDHLWHLRAVFQEMEKNQLYAKRSKCFFGVKRIEYLGHFITEEGVSTDPQKIEAVKYYRRFIQGFGIICKPLTDLLHKDSFKWSPKATESFEKLKVALTNALVLALPDPTKTFVVETDASGYGIGAVLMQQGHLIAFISKALSPRHAALSIEALKYLMEQKLHTNSQLMWLTKLMPFDYVIEYKKGVENKVADALSRVSGAELLALVVSITDSDLLQAMKNKADLAAYPGLLRPLPIPEVTAQICSFYAFKTPYTAPSVAKVFFDVVVRLHGLPETITSDKDAVLLSSFWKELFSLQGVQLNTSTTYHPQSDGQTEVLNRCLETYLRCFCNEDSTDWYSCLAMAEYWYNTSYHSAIHTTRYEAL
nr:uncharacterized protein LOC117279428 [Nicotiana tomentosiformis]